MLHILWIIGKSLLILLGVVLGLLLLLLLLVLFCPVRYRASVRKEREQSLPEATGVAQVSWLFRGIVAEVAYREKDIAFDLRIFGLSLFKLLNRKKKPKKQAAKKPESSKAPVPEPKLPEPKPESEKAPEPVPELPEPKAPEEKKPEEPKAIESKPAEQKKPEKPDPKKEKAKAKPREAAPAKPKQPKKSLGERWEELKKKLLDFQKKMEDKKAQAEWWKRTITHERTKAAIRFLGGEVKRLLRHIFPKRLKGEVTLGFEDPSVTGKILAVLGSTLPLHRNRVAVTPLWYEGNVLYGWVTLSGRIYGFMIVYIAARVFFNRNIRAVYRRIRHKEEKHGR